MKPGLIEGDGGVFDVALGDEVLFSKLEAGHFIEESAVIDLIRGRMNK